jgi:hypothetical protein
MRISRNTTLCSLLTATAMFALAAGCNSDDKPATSGTTTGGTGAGGEGTGGADASTGGTSEGGESTGGAAASTGGTSAGGEGTGGGTAASTGGTGAGGQGTGGASTSTCNLSGAGLPHQAIPNPTGNMTLTADKVWDLSDTTYVADGQTLTIQPCTRIEGAKSPLGTLVVSRGGKIMADGRADAPILFTSKAAVGSRAQGDWGGVILLGKAPNFQGDQVNIEGLAADPKNQHGGTVANDNSGVLRYVGIQFPGFELFLGNEINGLTLGSVGSGTTIENVFIAQSADDCIEFFGGTVSVKNIVGQNCDDDDFDTDYGWSGTIENAFGRYTYAPTESSNGIETGYDQAVAITPLFNLTGTYRNVTTCGFGSPVAKAGYGILSRAYVETHVDEFVATGYDYGFNQEFPKNGAGLSMSNTVFFGMFADAANQVANPADDNTKDNNFDELALFTAGTNNSTTALGFTAADCKQAGGPAAAVKSSGRGAFKSSSTWMDWVPANWWADN